uniref:Uncharacterized protein n=1 Tax=Anguilla anguilla TaxID=7936 RepID=A0A0E9V7N4_ANGAN
MPQVNQDRKMYFTVALTGFS